MQLRLSELRAECERQPFVARVVQICAVTRQVPLTRFAWVQEQREGYYGAETFKELLLAFQALERCGFGRILQGSQMARARFQWAVMPVNVGRALSIPGAVISPRELLPAVAELGISLPPPWLAIRGNAGVAPEGSGDRRRYGRRVTGDSGATRRALRRGWLV